MKRNEAEELIGSLVITGLIKGGIYIGELLDITPSKPFRANVKIKGVLKHPELYNHNTKPLCFKRTVEVIRENEIVDTGNSIEKYEDKLISYDYSLKSALLKYLSSVEKTLSEFTKNIRFSTWYINDKEDCSTLRDILVEKIKYVSELEKQKDFLGIVSVEGDLDSLIAERLNFAEVRAEVVRENCELTIGSVKVILKHNPLCPYDFTPGTISKIKSIIVLDEYIKGYLSLDSEIANKSYLKIVE